MIYTFNIPTITDTKNLKKVFAKKKYVTKENLLLLEQVDKQRTEFKQASKALIKYKPEENPPEHIVKEFNTYADSSFQLMSIFDKDYKIKKNWKWTPVFTNVRLLKFSKDIKYGKSGEVIMANWADFALKFREVGAEIYFVQQNFYHEEGESLQADLRFSSIKQRDPIVLKFEANVMAILKKYVDAWTFLKNNDIRLSPCFQTMSIYDENVIEIQGISVEIALCLVQINANILYIEVLKRRANYEEMGRYAKSIVTLADTLLKYLRPFSKSVNPDLIIFGEICKRLYKSIALWSLFFPYLAKVKAEAYGPGENMNVLAGACVSFVDEIGKLHAQIKGTPGVEKSAYYHAMTYYFTKGIVSKSSEVAKVYGDLYKNASYDESHYSGIGEKDYIAENAR